METSQRDEDKARRAEFARLFAQHDRWLFAYLVSLLGNASDAQEVFQEVCVTLWSDYEQFQFGTSFPKWVSVVALNQVRRFRRQRQRQPSLLSEGVVESLAVEAVDRVDLMSARRDALHGCIQKLKDRDRELIKQCYSGAQGSFREVADQLGKPANTVYKAVNRIRRTLHSCIDKRLTQEGVS